MFASSQGDWFPISVLVPPHFKLDEPKTFRPALFGYIQRNWMPKGRAEHGLVHDIGTLDLWEIRGGENAVSRRAKLLAVQSASLSRCQFSEHRAY
jgi:hypothetical protein